MSYLLNVVKLPGFKDVSQDKFMYSTGTFCAGHIISI